jgi:hypothetical protein
MLAHTQLLPLELGGDPEAVFHGAFDDDHERDAPGPEYPAEEADEG